jgi:hypothetical protein
MNGRSAWELRNGWRCQPVRICWTRLINLALRSPRAQLESLRRAQDHPAILETPVIEKILAHLGLQARAPPRAPALVQMQLAA